MSRIRTVFLGTPDFSRHCLEALIKDDHFEVVGVITQPDRPSGRHMKLTPSPVKALVEPLGIPLLTPETVNTAEISSIVAGWRAEVAIVVAFGQILKQEFLDLLPRKIVNVHTSLLPRWRGAAPIQRAIMAGDRETGVCLQVMEFKLDAGDVLGFRRLPLTQEMNAFDLHEALKPLAVELLTVDLMDYLRGNLSAIAQDPTLVTYAAKINKGEAQIEWRKPAEVILNQIRGLALGPAAVCRRPTHSLKIHKAKLVPNVTGSAGEVVRIDEDSFTVACEEQGLEIFEVQPESRARMKVADYLKGYPLKVGEMLL